MSELALIAQGVEENPELVMPLTGVIVDLRDPNQVADALDQLTDIRHRLDELRGVLTDALRLEAHLQGTKTLYLDELKAVIHGGERTEYDGHKLALQLRAAGLPEDRVMAAVQEVISYKPDGRVLKQLAGANPEYREIIEACRSVVPAPWRATITRAR
jgi:hypothetical protein